VLDKDRLLQARASRNLTQADAARELLVSRSEYGRWERGLTQPRPQHLIRIARFCQCEIEDLRIAGPDGYVLTHRRPARIRFAPQA
jgi:transcriptional regulator with XRE-family HTH domain